MSIVSDAAEGTTAYRERLPTSEIDIIVLDHFVDSPEVEKRLADEESVSERTDRLYARALGGKSTHIGNESIDAVGSIPMSREERLEFEEHLRTFARAAIEQARKSLLFRKPA